MFLEINLASLALFAMSAVGLTNILIYGKILNIPREWFKSLVPEKVGEALECYQCTGFWAGAFAGACLLTLNPFGVLMAGLAGSFLSEFVEVVKEYLEANSMINLDHRDDGGMPDEPDTHKHNSYEPFHDERKLS